MFTVEITTTDGKTKKIEADSLTIDEDEVAIYRDNWWTDLPPSKVAEIKIKMGGE